MDKGGATGGAQGAEATPPPAIPASLSVGTLVLNILSTVGTLIICTSKFIDCAAMSQ